MRITWIEKMITEPVPTDAQLEVAESDPYVKFHIGVGIDRSAPPGPNRPRPGRIFPVQFSPPRSSCPLWNHRKKSGRRDRENPVCAAWI